VAEGLQEELEEQDLAEAVRATENTSELQELMHNLTLVQAEAEAEQIQAVQESVKLPIG
jgi:hypothetical protein